MRANSEIMLEYYKRELTYLRRMGMEFAARYPKVASRLELSDDQCPDPHIERLIESFAFLTARIQHHLESEFPELAAALLGVLYPQFLNPLPAMTIARFVVDPSQGKLTSGHVISKGTTLYARTDGGQSCRFMTCYPVSLWPLTVVYAGFESTDQFEFLDSAANISVVLRIRIEATANPLFDLGFTGLRFFLNGDRMLANALYELLFAHVDRVALLPDTGGPPAFLPAEAVVPVGFSADEDVLPYPPNAHSAYRLLHEYFTFPSKYLFFDLNGLDRHGGERFFDILLLLDRMPGERLSIGRETFSLGCTPVINLFRKTTDPIRLSETRAEYLVQPDKRRERITEIHSIRTVSTTADPRDAETVIEPFFSFNHLMERRDQKSFWIARRHLTGRKDLPGTHLSLSFLDLDFNPLLPPATTVFAHTLCTNRGLAEDLPAGAILQLEQAAPLARIHTLAKPTAQVTPPLEGAALWRLISHLSLNYLSLTDGEAGLAALREILKLYSFADPTVVHDQVAGIRKMDCRPSVRRAGPDAWRGFCRGFDITLTFDERQYVGTSAFLLAAVLNRFFPLYAAVNTFTRLTIRSIQREGIWKRWDPMVGDKIVL